MEREAAVGTAETGGHGTQVGLGTENQRGDVKDFRDEDYSVGKGDLVVG